LCREIAFLICELIIGYINSIAVGSICFRGFFRGGDGIIFSRGSFSGGDGTVRIHIREVGDDRLFFFVAELRKRRHEPLSPSNNLNYLRLGKTLVHIGQRWIFRGLQPPGRAVTACTIPPIYTSSPDYRIVNIQ